MVSLRCKMVVKQELQNLGLHCINIELGKIEILEKITDAQKEKLGEKLISYGLELLDDKRKILIEKISEKLGYDYTYLANIFSEVKGVTIQQYIILHKIERVKELLLYDELSLKEISYLLNYSSIAHLSSQFKKVTGLTPSYFKKLKEKRFVNLEDL